MVVNVKVSLRRNSGMKDCRMYTFDGYTVIEEVIKTIEGDFSLKGIQLYWLDEDNDEIELKTKKDLDLAILLHYSKTLRIVIFKRSEEFHRDVTCESCEESIRGFRYKCLECPDLSLCAVCENKGSHPDHVFVRIPSPDNNLTDPAVFSRLAASLKSAQDKEGSEATPPGDHFQDHSRRHQEALHREFGVSAASTLMKDFSNAFGPAAFAGAFAPLLNVPILRAKTDINNHGTKVKHSCRVSRERRDSNLSKISEAINQVAHDTAQKTAAAFMENGGVEVPINVDKKPTLDNSSVSTCTCADLRDFEISDLESRCGYDCTNGKEYSVPINISDKPYSSIEIEKSLRAPRACTPHPNPRVEVSLQAMLNMGFKNEGGWLVHLLESVDGDVGKALDATKRN